MPRLTRTERRRLAEEYYQRLQMKNERRSVIDRIARRCLHYRLDFSEPPIESWGTDEGGVITNIYSNFVIERDQYEGLKAFRCKDRYDTVRIGFLAQTRLVGINQYFSFEEVWRKWCQFYWMKRVIRRNYDVILARLYKPGGYFCNKGWDAIEAVCHRNNL